MKVAFNIHPLKSGHKFRGIGSYTFNLLKKLKQQTDLSIIEFENISEVKDVDIVHYPFFDLFQNTLPINKKFPTLVTIHDVTPLVFPNYYPPGIKGSIKHALQRIALKKIDAVITDSKSSKKDIARYLKVSEDKIHPIYLAISDEFQIIKDQQVLQATRKQYNLPDRFALYTGNVNWNKNLINIAQACIESGINLVLIGGGFEKKENLDHPELKSFKEFKQKYADHPLIRVLGFMETSDLVTIMNLASVTLLPSFYEGFGLPILESQACGTPVITSNVSSMPEVAGDGAVMVDPYNVSNIKDAILNITEDKQRTEQLVAKGLKNVKRFSWDRTAFETVEVYKSIV